MRYVVVTLCSVALVALLEGVRQLARWKEERRRDDLRRRLEALGDTLPDAGTSLLRDQRLAASPFLDELLRAFPPAARLKKLLDQTDLPLTVAQLLAWSLLAGCAGLVVPTLFHVRGLAVPLAALGAWAPFGALLVARGRRSARVSEQLPEALDMLSRSLRAGHALSVAFEVVAKEMPEPIAVEFGRAHEAQRLGVSVEGAIAQISERVPGNGDVKMLVVSVTIQRETGGNLAEILGNLADTIRARYRFQGKLRALTAEGRASALALALLPFLVTLGLTFLSPRYLDPLVQTPLGRVFLAYAIVTWIVGVFWLNRMAKVDF